MSSLNQRINKKLDEVLSLMREQNARKTGRTSAAVVAGKPMHTSILAEAGRRRVLAKNDKRNKVKPGLGIRPAILEVLLKSRKDLKRSEVAELVARKAPKGVEWSLGSCNLALGGLVKDRLIKKENMHGGKFSITANGKSYAKTLKRTA